VNRFRGGLVFKALRLVCHSTLGSRVIKKTMRSPRSTMSRRSAQWSRSFFFVTLVKGPRRSLSLNLSDTRVYEPQIRARLGTTAHFCEVDVLRLRRTRKQWSITRAFVSHITCSGDTRQKIDQGDWSKWDILVKTACPQPYWSKQG